MVDVPFGVEPFKLHHKCEKDEKINYYDITRFYPYVQAYKQFPIGHPEIILKDFKTNRRLFWLCKIVNFRSKKSLHFCSTYEM
jgi:hypothetical protein